MKLNVKQLEEMGVKEYPMKKLSMKDLEKPLKKNPKPKSLRSQLMNLLDNLTMSLMLEPTPTLEEHKVWASKAMQRQWRQKQKKYKRNQKLQRK